MALPVEKLESFGLENFINIYRFYLCKRTVSQNQIAAFLQFDSDYIAIITHPPDNFSKCEKLYELIERTCQHKVKDFLEALDETGNEHIIKFIKDTDFAASGLTVSNRGIWFNIPELIKSFCGREDFLTNLHDKLKPQDDSETEVTVLSQVKIVSGLGGIGKTETATKYIMKHRQFYNNFIWINAESESSMRNSFLELAKEINIPVKDSEGKPKEIKEIVKEIYNKICEGGKSNLIVFDNAEDIQSCKNFFPFGLHPELTKPVILATSRNQEWISQTGRIQILPLDVLTYDESLKFIRKQLEIPESEIPKFREESKEFIKLIGGLPLALQQAVAYIRQEKELRGFLGDSYKMSDYVKEFKFSMKKFQSFSPVPDSPTVFVTWDLTLEKMKKDPKGEIAIQIIEALSFLYADKIPVEFLLQLLPFPPLPQNWITRLRNSIRRQRHESTDRDLAEGLQILSKFSMIKITAIVDAPNFVSIHRQVQFVIIQNLKSSGRLIKVFDNLIEKCTRVLEKMRSPEVDLNFDYTDLFLNLQQLVSHHFDSVPRNSFHSQNALDFMGKFGLVLYRFSGEEETETERLESLEVNQQLETAQRDCTDVSERFYSTSLVMVSWNVLEQDYWGESVTLCRILFGLFRSFFGIITVYRGINTAFNSVIVIHQLKYEQTQKQFQKCLPQVILQHGEDHPLTCKIQNSCALLQSRISYLTRFGSFMNTSRIGALLKLNMSLVVVLLVRVSYNRFERLATTCFLKCLSTTATATQIYK